ncbi:phage baseplate assembly protein V [Sphingomonas hengshuiensis]|uniref:phage baseplate assembly protein V n=1 Tax=Sphingomonas hengshuiensis TaxID=1609977 RepID=UPI000696E9CB|nr:phage baseplate assembly protein V [Sphingomonas hengshuiensis]
MNVAASIAALGGRMQMAIGRCVLRAVADDKACQEVQIDVLADETIDGVEHFQTYGLSVHPHPEAEGVLLSVGGRRGNSIVIAVGDRRYRLKGMQAGEVALYDDLGQVVRLTRDGILISSAQGVTIETEGDLSMTAQGDMTIGAGGSLSIDAEAGIAITSAAGASVTADGALALDGASIAASADGAVTIDGASLTAGVSGAVAINSDNVGIGNGATLGAARRTDAVNDSDDVISGGSSKVRIA